MSDDYLTAEARARFERIDRCSRDAGWVVQRFKDMNLGAAEAVAVREFPTPSGPVDYLLYVDGSADRALEAKKEGVALGSVEPQSTSLLGELPGSRRGEGLSALGLSRSPSTTRAPATRPPSSTFATRTATARGLRLPSPRDPARWAEADTTFRARLRTSRRSTGRAPPGQVEAISSLEASYALARPVRLSI